MRGCVPRPFRDAVERLPHILGGSIGAMELKRVGMAFGAAMGATREDARMRAEEKRISRQRARHCRGMLKPAMPRSWGQRLDASIDPVIACVACAMLGW